MHRNQLLVLLYGKLQFVLQFGRKKKKFRGAQQSASGAASGETDAETAKTAQKVDDEEEEEDDEDDEDVSKYKLDSDEEVFVFSGNVLNALM